jgi:hypothetical protein
MVSGTSLRGLPGELQNQIISELPFPDSIYLSMTCHYFQTIIVPLSHAQLLKADWTEYAEQHNLYACFDCLRLRPRACFGDKMVKKKKSRVGKHRNKRFCLDCGVRDRPGGSRYSEGSHIALMGVHHVICGRCTQFGVGAIYEGINRSLCQRCWTQMQEL